MRARGLEPGAVIGALAAATLAAALYAPWYRIDRPGGAGSSTVTGWVGLSHADVLLAGLAVIGLLTTIHFRARRAAAIAQAIVGALAGAIVCWRLLALPVITGHPGERALPASGLEWGAILALAGAVGVVATAAPRMFRGRDRRSSPQPAATEAAVSQAGELRSARIESLRALAALSVLAYHSLLYSKQLHPSTSAVNEAVLGGAFGVFFFFTLSGYLLFWPFVKAIFGGGRRINLGRYAINRALRILPLYYFLITLLLLTHQNASNPGQWWRFALFAENFSADTFFRGDAPMWSLVVEVQFYLLLPLIAALIAWVARRSPVRAALLLAVIGGVSLVLRVFPIELPLLPTYLWKVQIATLFFFFAAGMLLALLRLAWEAAPPRWLSGPLASADAWILASAPFWIVAVRDHRFEGLVAVAAFLMIGASVLPLRRGWSTRLLEWRTLAVLGLASYSLYLWHTPVIAWLAGGHIAFKGGGFTYDGPITEFPRLLLLALVVCGAIALLSYRFIESPFLRLRRRWTADAGAAPAAPRGPYDELVAPR